MHKKVHVYSPQLTCLEGSPFIFFFKTKLSSNLRHLSGLNKRMSICPIVHYQSERSQIKKLAYTGYTPVHPAYYLWKHSFSKAVAVMGILLKAGILLLGEISCTMFWASSCVIFSVSVYIFSRSVDLFQSTRCKNYTWAHILQICGLLLTSKGLNMICELRSRHILQC